MGLEVWRWGGRRGGWGGGGWELHSYSLCMPLKRSRLSQHMNCDHNSPSLSVKSIFPWWKKMKCWHSCCSAWSCPPPPPHPSHHPPPRKKQIHLPSPPFPLMKNLEKSDQDLCDWVPVCSQVNQCPTNITGPSVLRMTLQPRTTQPKMRIHCDLQFHPYMVALTVQV